MADEVVIERDKVLPEPAAGEKPPAAPDVEKLVADAVTKAIETYTKAIDELKANNAGLHRRISEQEQEKKSLDESKKTVEERILAVEEENKRKDRELAAERLYRQLQAAAEQRGLILDDELPMDKTNLTLEEGIEFLDKRKTHYEKHDAAIANKLMVDNSHKPGSGIEETDTGITFDPFDMSPGNLKKAEAFYDKKLSSA